MLSMTSACVQPFYETDILVLDLLGVWLNEVESARWPVVIAKNTVADWYNDDQAFVIVMEMKKRLPV